ncbi:hypothetical protein Gasu2_21940 [Galdieria sulphuraria]|nr:hypothetical protein Gasu2_21940 [Galdieria sulphuraria]
MERFIRRRTKEQDITGKGEIGILIFELKQKNICLQYHNKLTWSEQYFCYSAYLENTMKTFMDKYFLDQLLLDLFFVPPLV